MLPKALEILCEQVDLLLSQLPSGSDAHQLARSYAKDRALAWVIVSMARTDNETLAHTDTRSWNGAQLELARQMLVRTKEYHEPKGGREHSSRRSLDRRSIDSGIAISVYGEDDIALEDSMKLEVTEQTLPVLLAAAEESAENLAGLLRLLCEYKEWEEWWEVEEEKVVRGVVEGLINVGSWQAAALNKVE